MNEHEENLRNELARRVYEARLTVERAVQLTHLISTSTGSQDDWQTRMQVEEVARELDNLVASTTAAPR